MKRAFILVLICCLLIPPALALDVHPAFTGSPSVIYNDGVQSFSDVYISGDEFVQYSPRDELGRVGPAVAYLGPKRFQAPRETISNITPTGFKNSKYDFIPGALYHRCHLIAHRMTGSGEYTENLFTGTQFLNLGVMKKIEGQIAEYITRTQHHVLYKVTPDFMNLELVCRGVVIEAKSIEDDEISICIYAFNVQPGVIIDYATGENALSQYAMTMPDQSYLAFEDTEIPDEFFQEVQLYVLNTNRKRFHKPECSSVKDIKPENYQDYAGTREELIEMGYTPCGSCNP